MAEPIQMDIKVEKEQILCQDYQQNINISSNIQLEETKKQSTKDGLKDFGSISALTSNYFDIENDDYDDDEEHECTLCAKLFQSEKLFKAHIKEHLKLEELLSDSGGEEEFQKITEPETKNADYQSIHSEKSAHMHTEIYKKRKLVEAEFQKTNDVYKCSLCAVAFMAKTSFQKHMTRSHKKYKCYLCNYSHRKEDYVLLHMNMHEGRNEKQCRYCDKEFTTKNTTIRHMEVHRDTQKYQCDKCGMYFSQKTILYNHKLRHEAEEKPLRCEICMQKFKTKRTYRHHLITHQADRPRYTCEYCDRNFTEKYTLKVHKRTHHEEAELVREESIGNRQTVSEVIISTTETIELTEKPEQPRSQTASVSAKCFSCLLCDKNFPTRDQMNKHMEKDHDVVFKSLPIILHNMRS